MERAEKRSASADVCVNGVLRMADDSVEKKKSKEKRCFDKVLKCKSAKGEIAKRIREKILQNRSNVDCEGERPDIIIQSNTAVIGIEHCQTDVLFKIKRKKAQSLTSKRSNEIEYLVEKYRDKELLDEDVKSGTALKSVLDMVEEQFERKSAFEYLTFIDNFKRVCVEIHNDKCCDYRARLDDVAKGRKTTLGCLIEVPYTKEKGYMVTDNKGTRKQAIRGIPITNDMLQTIQKMTGFDFVILCMNCKDTPAKDKDTVCYYFIPQYAVKCARQQGIQLFDRFDFDNTFGLPYKSTVKFPKEKYELGAESVTFTAEVTPKK